MKDFKRPLFKGKKKSVWCINPSIGPASWVNAPSTFVDGMRERRFRKYARCPTCNKRLLPKAYFCIGGEFVGWKVPKHKVK